MTWLRVLQRKVRFNSEDPAQAYLVSLELASHDPPQYVQQEADVEFDLCNTVIENGNRDAAANGVGSTVAGEQWFFVITNTVHSPTSLTDAYFIIRVTFGGVATNVYSATMLPYEQGVSMPYAPWPGRTGTFTVPAGVGTGSFGAVTKSDYGGDATVDECWHVTLYRI